MCIRDSSSYPLTIEAEAADLGSMVEALSGAHGEAADGAQHELDAVYSDVYKRQV